MDISTKALQSPCINCICWYSAVVSETSWKISERVIKIRELSDYIKKPNSVLSIGVLHEKLLELNITIDIDWYAPKFLGDLLGFCSVAQNRALDIISHNKDFLISERSAAISESGC